MKQTDVSQLFSTPFGAQADSTTITTIPQSKPATGRASMLLGFSKDNGTPIAAGGTPPFLEDMNGILNMLASSARAAELGLLHPFSASYASAIGGYPLGSTVAHPTISGRFLICTQDNNTAAPPGNGWIDPLSDFVTNEALQAAESNLATGSRLLNKQVFGTGGNYTYTPTTGTQNIIVKLCGAGGGGGGVHGNGGGYVALSFGGAGGTYAETSLIPVPATPVNIVVGSGGAGGAGYNYGGNGGLSSFGTIITCPGGPGGARGWYIGAGGQMAWSNWVYSNAPTGNYIVSVQGSGPSAVLFIGGLAAAMASRGGGSFFGDGAEAFSFGGSNWQGASLYNPNSNGNGQNAQITGTGGAGAYSNGSGDYTGGNGADGIVIVEEYC